MSPLAPGVSVAAGTLAAALAAFPSLPILQPATLAAAGVVLLLGAAVAYRLREPGLAGIAYGFLVLTAATNYSLYLLRATRAPAILLPVVGAVAAVALTEALRWILVAPSRTLPLPAETEAPNRGLHAALVAGLAAVVYLARTAKLAPESGRVVFQALFPLYVQESHDAGRFLRDVDMGLGRGLLSSLLYPAPDTLGLVAVLRELGLHDAFASYSATSLLSAFLGCAVLLGVLRGDRLAMTLYAALFTVYFFSEDALHTVLGYVSGDEGLFLGGALACHYLFGGRPGLSEEARLSRAGLAAAFLVLARNFGAYFGVAMLAYCTWRLWPGGVDSRRRLAALWLVLAALAAYEIGLVVASGSVYYPLPATPALHPRSWTQLGAGTLVSWGLAVPAGDTLRPSASGLYLIGLAVALLAGATDPGGHRARWALLLAPLAFLVAPMSLEIISGYRKHVGSSKIYLVSLWLPTWYPAYLLSRTPRGGRALSPRGLVVLAYALVVALLLQHGAPGFQSFRSGMLNAFAERFLRPEWRDQDRKVADAIRAALTPEELEALRRTPIVYFHYEPGIGLRHHLGGRLFQDYDFWSEPVQSRMQEGTTLEDLLRALGGPNLYLSLGPHPSQQSQVAFPYREAVWRDLARFAELPYVKRVFRQETGVFLEIDPALRKGA